MKCSVVGNVYSTETKQEHIEKKYPVSFYRNYIWIILMFLFFSEFNVDSRPYKSSLNIFTAFVNLGMNKCM